MATAHQHTQSQQLSDEAVRTLVDEPGTLGSEQSCVALQSSGSLFVGSERGSASPSHRGPTVPFGDELGKQTHLPATEHCEHSLDSGIYELTALNR